MLKRNLRKTRKTSFFGVFGCEASSSAMQAASKNDGEQPLAVGPSIRGQIICPAVLDWPDRTQAKARPDGDFAQSGHHARICV